MPREKTKVEDEEVKKSSEEETEPEDTELEEDEENSDEAESTEILEEKQAPIFQGVSPTVEPPQVINGVVVPRTPITGFAHAHHMMGYVGAHTSKQVGKPTTHVRYSHPGLKAVVTRKFDNTKLALMFVKNPNNAAFHPVFVDPDSVHGEEMQDEVTVKRQEQTRLKHKYVDAPIGSPEEADFTAPGDMKV